MVARLLALIAPFLLVACAWFRPHAPEHASIALESGVVVRDQVVPESGAPVRNGDTVAIHYELRLADRSLLESSRDMGQPLRFVVGQGLVPVGLEQGLLGMRLYGRRRIQVPARLGYGAEGRPPRIPPDSALTFEVELMEHVQLP